MPEGRYAGIIILAEDAKQARFIRSWLQEHVHVDRRAIRDVLSPKGRGAGEQFVRLNFPAQVRSHHRNARSSMLIAIIDADMAPFKKRYDDLFAAIESREGVFVFVPKRNVETWLRALNGFSADESTDFKRSDHGTESGAGKKFLHLIRTPPATELLPSLEFALAEARSMPRDHTRRS